MNLTPDEYNRMIELEAIAHATKRAIENRELDIRLKQDENISDKEYLAELDLEYQPLLRRWEMRD